MSKKKSTFRKSIFSSSNNDETSTLPLEKQNNNLDFYQTQYDEMNSGGGDTVDFSNSFDETPTLLKKSFSFESSNEFTNKTTRNYGLNTPNGFEDENEKKIKDNGIDPIIDPIPLLEELEIDFYLMWKNIRFVLNPFSKHSSISINELDLSGPIVICLALGFVLLLVNFINLFY